MSLICVAEKEVCFYLSHRAPLGHRELADLEENVDGELVLKGDWCMYSLRNFFGTRGTEGPVSASAPQEERLRLIEQVFVATTS